MCPRAQGLGAGIERPGIRRGIFILRKVIVIGLDGLEPKIVDAMLAAGELPNLRRLATSGGYSRVATTTPAQTPVAWSTFATGTNPGGHGVFDFIRRDPTTYMPDLALSRYETRGAFLPPKAVNMRRGTPVWEVLGEAGLESIVIRCPVTYPPDAVRGRMLAGMGVPDLRGSLGTTTFYTMTPNAVTRESENVVPLTRRADGTIATHVIGPRPPRGSDNMRFALELRIDAANRRLIIHSAGEPRDIALVVGQWSDWLRVTFKAGLLQTIRGMVRFHLVQLEPNLELHASPVNFDDAAPPFPLSHPAEYANELAEAIGRFHTTGMVEDHTGIINERIGEEAFLDQCELAWREREAMMLYELERFDAGLFYCLFDTPDRVQHLFWRFREPNHPANRGRCARPDLARVIEDQYRRSDEVLGKALDFVDDTTLMVALSDHGFGSFRRGVNLNTILHDLGYLALRDGIRPGPGAGEFFRSVDWSRTRAYALGLGGIYLNIAGREQQGTLVASGVEEITRALTRQLRGLIDPHTGDVAIRGIRSAAEVYSGPHVAEAPDLLIDFASGYRASWSTSLGGLSTEHFEDNTRKWSGDHIIDPQLVPGVLFMNQNFHEAGAALIDLAPTILDALGVPKPAVMEGGSLLT
jgi:predicted AlkP superfamily phosphohydrolase/phosphomutase